MTDIWLWFFRFTVEVETFTLYSTCVVAHGPSRAKLLERPDIDTVYKRATLVAHLTNFSFRSRAPHACHDQVAEKTCSRHRSLSDVDPFSVPAPERAIAVRNQAPVCDVIMHSMTCSLHSAELSVWLEPDHRRYTMTTQSTTIGFDMRHFVEAVLPSCHHIDQIFFVQDNFEDCVVSCLKRQELEVFFNQCGFHRSFNMVSLRAF